MTVAEAALQFAERGWPVFPCSGKTPVTQQGLKEATATDRGLIEGWWNSHPDANVAVVTGNKSGVFVLDVDGDEGAKSLRTLEGKHGELPATASVKTPRGGSHFYFKHPGGEVRNSAGRLGTGLDVRGDGGYVIAPPSPGYVVDEEVPIAAAPQWLLDAIREVSAARRNGASPVGDTIPAGSRNTTLTSLAGTMRRCAMGEAEIAAALREANRLRCHPPLDDKEVGRIAASVARYAPADAQASEAPPPTTTPATSTLTSFTEIVAKPVRFLWRDRIALGKITALAGRPKIGKGLLYSHLIAEVTRGTLDGDLDGPRKAIIVTTEDEPGDTLKPRLMAAGADISLVSYFTMGSAEEPVPFRVPQDAAELGRRVDETEAALVIIDPLIEFIDGKADSHKSQPVRQAVAALNTIARERGCAVLTIFHLNKGISTDPLLRHEGSAAFTQVVRAGLMLGFDPEDPEGEGGDQRVLAVSASNLARLATSLVYRIEGALVDGDLGGPITTAQMHCIGESGAASHDLLGGREDEESRADRDEATEFLRAELAEGPQSAKGIKAAARTVGVTDWSLKSAKKKLRVRSEKSGMEGGWVWSLPEGDDSVEEAPFREDASPSSPSASRAKSGHPLRGGSTEGDGPQGTIPFESKLPDPPPDGDLVEQARERWGDS